MTTTRWTLRVLWTVSPHFFHVVVIISAVTAFGIWTVHTLPDDAGAPYVLLLFCQLFAASSGFRPAADAGRYDAIIVAGASRHHLAGAHWLLSVTPGIVAWLTVCAAEFWWLGPGQSVGVRLPSVSALVLISTVAWAVSLPTARFFGGTAWILTMGAIAGSSQGADWVRSLVDRGPPDGIADTAQIVGKLVAVPFMYLVPPALPVAGSAPVLLATGSVSLVALAGGVLWVACRDFSGGS